MTNKKPLDNAADIIDRFGGIRPLASKINVAVTTVQGWKKRDAIPANRYNALIAAAKKYDVDLSDIIDDAPAPASTQDNVKTDNVKAEPTPSHKGSDLVDEVLKAESQAKSKVSADETAPSSGSFSADMAAAEAEALPASFIASMLHDDIVGLIVKSERRAVIKSTWTTIFLIILTVGAIGFIFWPQSGVLTEADRQAEIQRLQALEEELNTIKNDIDDVKSRQGFFGRVIPEDLNERLGELQSKVESARDGAENAVNEARAIADEALSGQTEALQQRIGALEGRLSSLTDMPLLAALSQRYEAFTVTAGGQDLLAQTTGELASLLSGAQGAADAKPVDEVIAEARAESPVLSQSFEGVPADDLKAAALLLTMTQLRSTLNRPGESFASDLGLLRNLVGDENTDLMASIDKLSPHADAGVLTPAGLSEELKSLTGEIVVASLQGEDVSFQERAKARLNSVFQVEKDGELVTGTPTQAAVVKAQDALAQGDLAAAITQMQGLDGPAAAAVAPWLDKAKATLIAQQFKATLSGALSSTAAGLSRYTAGGAHSNYGASELIVDPISGVSVLKRQSAGGSNGALPELPKFE